jgi:mannose-1-phosphate guanylyltransferase
MFAWSVPTVLGEFNRHAPTGRLHFPASHCRKFREEFYVSALANYRGSHSITQSWKADRVLVVEASFDWDDIGSWRAVANYFKNDEQRNASNCAITAVDSTNNIVFDENGTTIALLESTT